MIPRVIIKTFLLINIIPLIAQIGLPFMECIRQSQASEGLVIPLEVVVPNGVTGLIPVTVGVPVPLSDLEVGAYTVVGLSGPVPCQIRSQVRTNGSSGPITWLLVDFQAMAGTSYTLQIGNPPVPTTVVTVQDRANGGIIVNTGAGLWEIPATTDLLASVFNAAGNPLLVGAMWGSTSPANVEIVESGPLRVMVRLRAQRAIAGLDLVARMHFYAGMPYARVQLTLINHTNPVTSEFGQPLCNNLNSVGTIVVEDVTWVLRLASPEPDRNEVLYQDSSGTDYWNFYRGQGPRMQYGVTRRGYVRTVSGVEVETGNVADGILAAGGVRVEVPYFRELFPKALRACQGQLEFAIFPGEFSISHRLRPGEQKTHDIWISLDSQVSPPWQRHCAPAFDYLSTTTALGFIGPRTGGKFQEYENYIDAQLSPAEPYREDCGRANCPRTLDESVTQFDHFGWTDFGDVPTDFEDGRSPYNLKYDVTLGFLHQAIRTGNAKYWRWAEISNLHFADVDILHSRVRGYSSDRAWFQGGTWGHSLHDESGLRNPHRNYNNPHPDTTWGGVGMAAWSLLTGDDVVREAAIELADNILWRMRNTDYPPCARLAWGGGNGTGYGIDGVNPRAAGNAGRLLLWAWKLTGDQAYLEGPKGTARWYQCERQNLTCGSWPNALAGRAIGEYILYVQQAGLPVDPSALPALQGVLTDMANNVTVDGDRMWFSGCTNEEINAWMFLAADVFALGYAATGERSWLDDYAWRSFSTAQQDPFYPGDLSHYHSTKELVNSISAGTVYLYFVSSDIPGTTTTTIFSTTTTSRTTTSTTTTTLPPKICHTCLPMFGVKQGKTKCRSFKVWNCGGGTLTWMISEDCPWLTLSPSNGASTEKAVRVKACVNMNGLNKGDYQCTVTITGADSSNTPQMCVIRLRVK